MAASKPAGNFLELGTGTGVSTAWLLSGMDAHSKLITIENDRVVASIATKYLEDDQRLSFYVEDAEISLKKIEKAAQKFDLIFADTWVGKYIHLNTILRTLKLGGLYVIDDMLPQATWPEGHEARVAELLETLEGKYNLLVTKLNWASGIVIATKTAKAVNE